MVYKIKRKVNSDISIVKNVVDDILLNIHNGLDDNILFNTRLILNELIINGIRHGNREDRNKYLNICVCLENSQITIEISDEGSGVRYKHKSYGELDFNESGRGLMLVEGLCDKFVINGNKVTCVQFFK